MGECDAQRMAWALALHLSHSQSEVVLSMPSPHTTYIRSVLIQLGCACRFDPLGLGANEERLTWFAESERVHARWAMLAVAGILVQVSSAEALRCGLLSLSRVSQWRHAGLSYCEPSDLLSSGFGLCGRCY